ncbi:MAG: hypothetical protein SGJ27_19915 [Candidatus Melainabacteria bacterium]|nr:hypothetical protein [Candidatus Melainabacteria bacterium]
MKLLTDAKTPVIAKRIRFANYLAIGTATSTMFFIVMTVLGAVCIAAPVQFFLLSYPTGGAVTFVTACVSALVIWSAQFYAGKLYMNMVSRLGFANRKEVLTPLFLPSIVIWGGLAFFILAFRFDFASLLISTGFLLNLAGQRQTMVALRRGLPHHHTTTVKIESAAKSSEFQNQLYDLKTAESIEHLEQMSKQCLSMIKPAATGSSDCTSILIDELMRRKLRTEADELSMLQLKLIDHQS